MTSANFFKNGWVWVLEFTFSDCPRWFEFDTEEEAKAYAKSKGFPLQIIRRPDLDQ